MARYTEAEREKILATTRQKLMGAAVEEFAHKSYAEANINRISEAAGYAKGTVYNYFASKEALMQALLDEVVTSHFTWIAKAVRAETDPVQRLNAFYQAGFDFVEKHPAKARLLLVTLYGSDRKLYEYMGTRYAKMFNLVGQEILEPGIAQGVFRPVELMLTTTLIMTTYLGTCSQVDETGKPLLDPHQVAEFSLHALRP